MNNPNPNNIEPQQNQQILHIGGFSQFQNHCNRPFNLESLHQRRSPAGSSAPAEADHQEAKPDHLAAAGGTAGTSNHNNNNKPKNNNTSNRSEKKHQDEDEEEEEEEEEEAAQMERRLRSMQVFLGRELDRLITHQQSLYAKLVTWIETKDQQRRKVEEDRRREDAERANREAHERAKEMALASKRDALILSYLEKITGYKINLPTTPPPTTTRNHHHPHQYFNTASASTTYPSVSPPELMMFQLQYQQQQQQQSHLNSSSTSVPLPMPINIAAQTQSPIPINIAAQSQSPIPINIAAQSQSPILLRASTTTPASAAGNVCGSIVSAGTVCNNRNSNSYNPRWPKEEVNALIQVRTDLEPKFRSESSSGLGLGLNNNNNKGTALWDEVSAIMSSMGYPRTAKRCKEKWENINKYYRKAKEGAHLNTSSSKKRARHSNTCSYFNRLEQLHSSSSTASNPPRPNSSTDEQQQQQQFLEAMLEPHPATISNATPASSSGNQVSNNLDHQLLLLGSHTNEENNHNRDHGNGNVVAASWDDNNCNNVQAIRQQHPKEDQ